MNASGGPDPLFEELFIKLLGCVGEAHPDTTRRAPARPSGQRDEIIGRKKLTPGQVIVLPPLTIEASSR